MITLQFQSEAARMIVAETAQQFAATLSSNGRLEPTPILLPNHKRTAGRRQKRRHYTISSSQPIVMETASSHRMVRTLLPLCFLLTSLLLINIFCFLFGC